MLNRYAMFGEPRLPSFQLTTVNCEGEMQLTIAVMRNLPILGSPFLAQQENLMTADCHRGNALVFVKALEAQNLSVEPCRTR